MSRYKTSIPRTETPIYESNAWGLGGTGWTQVTTTPGRAFGTQTGSGAIDDSIAILTVPFAANQKVSCVVHKAGTLSGTGFREVECIGRAVGGTAYGRYECNLAFDGQYADIVYLAASLPNPGYIFLNSNPGAGGPGSVNDGDIFSATFINTPSGILITSYLNGVQIQQATDTGNNLLTGQPGMGFYIQNNGGSGIVNSEYCISSWEATADSPIPASSAYSGMLGSL